jgi:hypothetical protein
MEGELIVGILELCHMLIVGVFASLTSESRAPNHIVGGIGP